jgi:L,D-transpeptidase ErfK/SrfK
VQIARLYDIGYDALRSANPEVDQWLPGDDTPVYLPTMSVLPDGPRDGIVVNLPAMRLFYFATDAADAAPGADGAPAAVNVTSHPIGIGREGWATPTGGATVTQRARDPTWYPPASVREEHAALGDPLPSVVPPGPDNPLGHFALRLSMPGYLIHGTNKPAGVGMRVSHGCIRLYPEDIEALYERIGIGTEVHIVDQPVLAGWRDEHLYLEVHSQLAEDERDPLTLAREAIESALAEHEATMESIDWERVAAIVAAARGMPFPVLASAGAPEQYLADARVIENLVPVRTEQSTASR